MKYLYAIVGICILLLSLIAAKPYTKATFDLDYAEKGALLSEHINKTNHHRSVAAISGVNLEKLKAVATSRGLKPKVLTAALKAYSWAYHHDKLGKNKYVMTVVDFTLPSYKKRMWVLDLHSDKVLMKLYTTHGSHSGNVYAKSFSNVNDSEKSSIGLFVTSDVYYGGHGKSMHLNGLQKGINDNARRRNVTIHPAYYASEAFVKAHHRAGRSWGCFAVSPKKRDAFLKNIKDGSAFFAYAPSIEKSHIINNGSIAI